MGDNETLEDVSFAESQAVIAKLTAVHDNQIKATVKLSEVYNYDYKVTSTLFFSICVNKGYKYNFILLVPCRFIDTLSQ